jgi:hypothetical protein
MRIASIAMAKSKKPKESQTEQSARFIEAAKKVEADERPEEFEKVLKKIAPSKAFKKKRAT